MKIWVKTTFDYAGENSTMPVFGSWFRLLYIENQGMAFGTTFGASIWAKLGLSIFRIFASGAIAYYFIKQWRKGAKTEFLIAIGLVFAGATGVVVVARSARCTVSGRVSVHTQPEQDIAQRRIQRRVGSRQAFWAAAGRDYGRSGFVA